MRLLTLLGFTPNGPPPLGTVLFSQRAVSRAAKILTTACDKVDIPLDRVARRYGPLRVSSLLLLLQELRTLSNDVKEKTETRDGTLYVHVALQDRMPNILFRTIPRFLSPPPFFPSLSDRIALVLVRFLKGKKATTTSVKRTRKEAEGRSGFECCNVVDRIHIDAQQ